MVFRKINEIKNKLYKAYFFNVKMTRQLLLHSELNSLRALSRYRNPKNLIPYGYKVYSQGDEDGIIAEIFKRINTTNKYFVELGVGNGLENNTLSLLFNGWKGLWVDGNDKFLSEINRYAPNFLSRGHLKCLSEFITIENVNSIISSSVDDCNIDLLSIDLDGNDYYIFDAIKVVKPRVVVIEYNAKFVPPTHFCANYKNNFIWKGDDNFGASLKSYEILFEQKGYSLVACSLTGVNAFFVRTDLLSNFFESPFSAEKHYEPARYYLVSVDSGHPASYEILNNI